MSQNIVLGAVFVAVVSYLIGSIPFGLLIGRLNHIDIRKYGSHNIGATNVRRVLGPDWGILCFACDFLKGLLPVLLLGGKLASDWTLGSGWGEILAAFAAVCGHVFPIYLGFKGGKGVSTTLGSVMGVAFWPVVVAGVVWFVLFKIGRMVSLASICAAVCMPVSAAVMRLAGWGHISGPAILVMAIMALLVVIRHKENIQRIKNGTESKFVKVKNKS